MKKKIFLIILIIILGIFLFLSMNRNVVLEQVLPEDIPVEVVEKILDLPSDIELGDLCSGKIECILFCKDNGEECLNYCIEHPDNELCAGFVPEDFEELPPNYSISTE